MRRKYQRDDKKSEFMGTYPRPHFCHPSTTPLGKSKSVTWSHWELYSQKFEAFLLQQGRRRFSVPHLVGLHLPKKKEIRQLLSPCEITRRETDGWLVNIRFVLLSHFPTGSRKFSMHCLSGSLQCGDVELLNMAVSQILASCLGGQHVWGLISWREKTLGTYTMPRSMSPKYVV